MLVDCANNQSVVVGVLRGMNQSNDPMLQSRPMYCSMKMSVKSVASPLHDSQFSCLNNFLDIVPVEMRQLSVGQSKYSQSNLKDSAALFEAGQSYAQLSEIVECAKSICVDMEDRDEDFDGLFEAMQYDDVSEEVDLQLNQGNQMLEAVCKFEVKQVECEKETVVQICQPEVKERDCILRCTCSKNNLNQKENCKRHRIIQKKQKEIQNLESASLVKNLNMKKQQKTIRKSKK